MGGGYLWVKAAHIIFVTSWFAGLFYLPRIYVNLATVDDPATRERLLTDGAQATALHDRIGGAGAGFRHMAY